MIGAELPDNIKKDDISVLAHINGSAREHGGLTSYIFRDGSYNAACKGLLLFFR